jgi:4,5-dihydroxyphthalate decarboxylase
MKLTVGCKDYEWLEPLIHGYVTSDELELQFFTDAPSNRIHDRTVGGDFDVAEFSLAKHILGYPNWEFIGLPVFPRRFFPHSHIFVNQNSNITEPKDLENKRVAIYQYQNTLALWARGILSEYYDVDLESIEWVTSRPETFEVPYDPEIVDHKTLPLQLSQGKIDALFLPTTNRIYPLPKNVTRMYSDPREAEKTYFQKSGFCPLMHDIVIRNEIIENDPWVATELYGLFQKSYTSHLTRITDDTKWPLAWWTMYIEEELEVFGDIWARSFDFNPNVQAELETMIKYAYDQHLISEIFDPRDLFFKV